MLVIDGRDGIYRELEFRNDVIPLMEVDGEVYVIVKPLVQQLGVSWAGQFVKLRASEVFGTVKITIKLDDRFRDYTCIPLMRLHDFLLSINWRKIPVNKLADENGKLFSVRRKVRIYEELFLQVLNECHEGYSKDLQSLIDVYQEA